MNDHDELTMMRADLDTLHEAGRAYLPHGVELKRRLAVISEVTLLPSVNSCAAPLQPSDCESLCLERKAR